MKVYVTNSYNSEPQGVEIMKADEFKDLGSTIEAMDSPQER